MKARHVATREMPIAVSGRTTGGALEKRASAELESALQRSIRGEVRFSDGDRALYATDASNYRQVPIGVVVPRDRKDVVDTVAECRRVGAPVLARGGGTSLAGQCCNVAVVIDMSKYMRRVLEIDPDRRLARVEPGCVLDDLRNAAEEHTLTFGPDPATHNHCTLGGMIGNNSCGVHSVMAGRTADNVEELEILTYDGLEMRVGATSEDELQRIISEGGRRGEIYSSLRDLRDRYADLIRSRYPKIPRRVSGYNLDELLPENGFNVARALVGTEGTCVTVLEATVRLVHSPPSRSLLVLGYPDVYSAGDHVPEIMQHGPTGLEGIDDRLIGYMRKKDLHTTDANLLPDGGGWLLVEFGGETKEESDARAREVERIVKSQKNPPSTKLFDDRQEEERIWTVRESGLGATANVPGLNATWPGWEDAAVPPDKLGGYLRDFRGLLERYCYKCALYGHFGQGCIHVRIDFNLRTREGIDRYLAFVDDAADLVVSYGGSLSGEHGDGQSRGALLPKMFGDELVEGFREFKSIWDPQWRMNPGKVVDPYAIDENLRLGTDYSPPEVETNFEYPDDHGSFAHATRRCVGVGKCRREGGGTMCPSYMVTLEEEHSTRGRARLLFEMLEGAPITDMWQSEKVREALDLCLACKGCKGDCPVSVDMATYKSEFLSHYYEQHRLPRSALTMGQIDTWARLASIAPGTVNFLTHAPGLREIAKLVADVHHDRNIPAFAGRTFKSWYQERPKRIHSGERVILWPDTFNNYFHPKAGRDAVRVLEHAGCDVRVPKANLCCGRPLYDWGMLDQAKSYLKNILTTLKPAIEAGTPFVVLEPSCASVFRDELVNMFPHDEDAKRLRNQTYLLSEYLVKRAPDFEYPQLHRQVMIQGHCHHKALMRMTDEETVFDKMGASIHLLDAGCCGMAGAFGFERDHYDVSIACGERALLPAVRNAAPEEVIVADGFSCREQIAQTTDRRALHLSEVLAMALETGPEGPPKGANAERDFLPEAPPKVPVAGLAVAGAALAGGALLVGSRLRSKRKGNGNGSA